MYNASISATGQNSQQIDKHKNYYKKIYGTGANDEDFRSYPAEGFTVDPNSRENSEVTSAESRQFYDYLTNPDADMMKVEMQIMGDPGFVGHDFAIPLPWADDKALEGGTGVFTSEKVGSRFGIEWDDELGAFNLDQSYPLVTLDFKFPVDINEKTGFHNFDGDEEIQKAISRIG